jgi:RecQ family ATP-dependent DNA helicase
MIQKEITDRAYILNIKNRKLLNGLLSDCFFNDRAKVYQLMTAIDCGVVSKILETEIRDEFLKERLASDIMNKSGYDKKTAEWIADTWLFCIDNSVIEAWNRYLAENSPEDESSIDEEINQAHRKTEENILPHGIFIPCGVGNEDKGFIIQGLHEVKECSEKHESIYAVIFNYLQRNSNIDEKNHKPLIVKQLEKQSTYEIDYRRIYRLMIIILLMVKNNYLQDTVLSFDYDGDDEEITIAYKCLNKYVALISRLCRVKEPKLLKYQRNSKLTISLNRSNSDINILEYSGSRNNRMIWYAKKLIYHITDESKPDLEYILEEISEYKSFNAGQFEVLKEMLNTQAHTVCIMPTGSGKSLIFYLCAILQPGVSFVISPTELLIKDQIRNLVKFHKFDDVKHLEYGKDEDFKNFVPQHKIYYLTPEIFQNRDLLKEFISLNTNKKIANLVLDEVHCISNWSHDFRPEYLMLSTYLNHYLDRTYYKCFTATANYSVIKDIKNQLQIKNDENIISPVKLEKDTIKFSFMSCEDVSEMIEKSVNFLKKSLVKGQKTLVFTKNENASKMLFNSLDDIKYEAAVYHKNDRAAYRSFAEDKCSILLASDELGIGINLSDVHNVLHFGLPISKAEFVQEIGRAGRNGEPASSLVVYLKCNSRNVIERLLHRNNETAEIIKIIQQEQIANDYIDTYKKIIGNIESQEEFISLLVDTYNTVKEIDDHREIDFNLKNIDKIKKCLFIHFAIGFVNNWSFCDIDRSKGTIKMLIAIKRENQTFEEIKEKTKNYLYLLGGNKKSISLVGHAKSIEEILNIYIEWYYNHFIYHHKEQFLDMLSFFEAYKTDKEIIGRKEIHNRLAAYFSLSMLEISQDEAKYVNLSFKNIAETIIAGLDYKTVSNIQRINQDNHNVKLDFFLFIYSLICDDEFDVSRIMRIFEIIDTDSYIDFLEAISTMYEKVSDNNKFLLFNDLCKYVEKINSDFPTFFDMIFRQNQKDLIYFGVMAKRLNLLFGG